MEATDLVKTLIALLNTENPTWVDVKKLLTKTQQHDCKFVGKQSIEGAINGLQSLLKQSSFIQVKEAPKTKGNALNTMCLIELTNSKGGATISCRCIKEKAVREPSVDGNWGINASSFKYVG